MPLCLKQTSERISRESLEISIAPNVVIIPQKEADTFDYLRLRLVEPLA